MPFVVTSWFGHRNDEKIPSVVREVWARKFRPRRSQRGTRQSNVDFAVLDARGKLVHWFDAVGSTRYARPTDLVTNTLKQLRLGASRIRSLGGPIRPRTANLLKLPDAAPGKSGVRVFVRLDDRLMPAYRLPVVEFVDLSARDWLSLQWPQQPRTVDASVLKKWLAEVYPPGVMERVDRKTKKAFSISSISGSLSLKAAVPDADARYAVASGRVRLGDSGGDGFAFEGDLDLVLTYARDNPAVQTMRGVFRGTYPRRDRIRQTTRHIRLEAVFESRPR
jgi:hypothetical protein